MSAVYWILQHVSDVSPSDDWLSASEREFLAGLRAAKRRREWRLGRWTAKRALARAGVAGVAESDLGGWARMSILTTEAGVPHALVGETEARWALSLSHSDEYGLCAVAERPVLVGCDIERIGRRGEEFAVDWFTDDERAFVGSIRAAEKRSQMVMLVWSAKESALKALGVGLRLSTQEVQVEPVRGQVRSPSSELDLRRPTPDAGREMTATGDRWSPLLVRAPGRLLHGWWWTDGNRVMTIVAEPAPASPLSLW